MKKLIALILALVCVLSLAGCGQPKQDPPEVDQDKLIYGERPEPSDQEIIHGEGQPLETGSLSQVEKLTLEKVKELAAKGEDLSWSDFEQYETKGDIGSGLYIFYYDIDENYYLLIGGGGKNIPPMYIHLCSQADKSAFIDIRTESIDDFINSISG